MKNSPSLSFFYFLIFLFITMFVYREFGVIGAVICVVLYLVATYIHNKNNDSTLDIAREVTKEATIYYYAFLYQNPEDPRDHNDQIWCITHMDQLFNYIIDNTVGLDESSKQKLKSLTHHFPDLVYLISEILYFRLLGIFSEKEKETKHIDVKKIRFVIEEELKKQGVSSHFL